MDTTPTPHTDWQARYLEVEERLLDKETELEEFTKESKEYEAELEAELKRFELEKADLWNKKERLELDNEQLRVPNGGVSGAVGGINSMCLHYVCVCVCPLAHPVCVSLACSPPPLPPLSPLPLPHPQTRIQTQIQESSLQLSTLQADKDRLQQELDHIKNKTRDLELTNDDLERSQRYLPPRALAFALA